MQVPNTTITLRKFGAGDKIMTTGVTKNLQNTLGKMEVALSTIKEVIVWTDLNGSIQWCNAPFDDIIGKQHIFSLGSNIFEVLPLLTEEGEIIEKSFHPVNVVLETKSFCDGYYQFVRDDRKYIFFISATFFKMGENEESVVVSIQDITKRRRLRDEKERAERQKQMAEEKLKIQTEFTSTVSHELRTPLASIKSSIDIMNSGTPGELTDDQKMFLEKVKSNVDRLNRLINDILDLSKMESGKVEMNFEMADVNQIIKETVENQESVAKEKGLVLEMHLEDNLPQISVDSDKLIQVFNNLINNSIKFTDEGRIAVSSKSCRDQNIIECCVKDTGIGIKKEHKGKLFEKFQQIGDSAKQIAGTGLGLAICKEIIKQHGGKIWFESEYGSGTSIYFILPIKERRDNKNNHDPASLNT